MTDDEMRKIDIRREIIHLLGVNETPMSALTATALNSLHGYLTGELVAAPYKLYSGRYRVGKPEVAEAVAVEMGFTDWCERLDYQTHVPEFHKDELAEILDRMQSGEDSRKGEQDYLEPS
jgi:hypothetical protein